jgi:lipopolysaccharide transport system permease protein
MMGKSAEVNQWDLVIKPRNSIFDLNFKEIWRYKDLIILFVKRDFVATYKQTILGPLWHLLQPILTTAMFLLLFSKIANIPTDGVKPVLFYMSGITIWNYFSICLTNTSNTFVTNSAIFGKVYFPRLILPLSVVLSNMIRFGIQFSLLLVMMLYFNIKGYPIHFGLSWLLVIPLILLMACLGLGLGILISSLTTKYRDFTVLMGFVMQLAIYAAPVAYPLSYLAQSKYQTPISLNPVTPVIEAFRFAIFGKGTFTAGDILYSVGFACVAVFVGLMTFSSVERSFMDTV